MPSSLNGTGVTFSDGTTQSTAASDTASAAFYQNVLNGSATVISTETFNSSGTWASPGRGTLALIEVWGAGGSGGRNSSGLTTFAGGGGGGAYSAFLVPVSSLPSSVTVTIGAGGASRTGSDQSGAAGGASSFGSVLSSNGGAGGASQDSPIGSAADGGVPGIPASPYFVVNAFNAISGGAYIGENGGDGGRGYTVECGCSVDYAANAGGSVTSAGGGGGAKAQTVFSNGGTSTYGGAASAGAATSSAGAQPGGGSGGATTTSGVGGAGRVRVTVY